MVDVAVARSIAEDVLPEAGHVAEEVVVRVLHERLHLRVAPMCRDTWSVPRVSAYGQCHITFGRFAWFAPAPSLGPLSPAGTMISSLTRWMSHVDETVAPRRFLGLESMGMTSGIARSGERGTTCCPAKVADGTEHGGSTGMGSGLSLPSRTFSA